MDAVKASWFVRLAVVKKTKTDVVKTVLVQEIGGSPSPKSLSVVKGLLQTLTKTSLNVS